MRLALAKLDWFVVRDFQPTESALFWKDSPEHESGEVRAEDIQTGEDAFHITTGPQEFVHVKKALLDKGFELAQAELAYVPTATLQVDPKDAPRVPCLSNSA